MHIAVPAGVEIFFTDRNFNLRKIFRLRALAFRRDLRRRDHENRPDEPKRPDPEGDGEHQHQPDDVHWGKAPA